MKKTIRIILKGGLGNQLFQYFAGMGLSEGLNRDLVIDTSWYKRRIHNNGLLDKRVFMLNQYQFVNNLNVLCDFDWRNSLYTERLLKKLPANIGQNFGFYFEPALNDLRKDKNRSVVALGHWIKNPILPDKSKLREQLIDGINEPSPQYNLLVKAQSNAKVISIHHRLGDYKNFGANYGVFENSYFEDAVRSIKKTAGKGEFEIWLFSDEPELSYSILSKSFPISRIVGRDSGINEAETISLISKSHAIIASNSTFSWWASYLSDESRTEVVFPEKYMKDILTIDTGLYVKGWRYL